MTDRRHIRSRKSTVRCSNDDLVQGKGRLPDVFQKKVTLRALAAIYTLIVPQHILDPVQSWRVVSAMLAAVATHNLHAQAPLDDLALVAVLKAHVLGGGAGVMVEFPPLVSALAVDLHDRTARTRVGICIHGKRVVEGYVTNRV